MADHAEQFLEGQKERLERVETLSKAQVAIANALFAKEFAGYNPTTGAHILASLLVMVATNYASDVARTNG